MARAHSGRRLLPFHLERLEDRQLLAADMIAAHNFGLIDFKPNNPERAQAAIAAITTTASPARLYTQLEDAFGTAGFDPSSDFTKQLANSTLRIKLDQFRADPRFAGIDGSGFGTVILDTGVDLDHPHFGPDADSNGIADRIVYQQSFVGGATANDGNGHGTHVTGIVGSQDATHTGMAPAASLISLQTNGANGQGSFASLEQALQWVVANAATYNIASVNMSLGDGGNYTEAGSRYGIGDELAALAALDVIVVSASGNSFGTFRSPGVAYPSSDPYSLSIGNRLTNSFAISGSSQRHPELTTIFAPGSPIVAATIGGGTRSLSGTSMASPHVAGVAVLMQELAVQELGRRLTYEEFEFLVRSSAVDLTLIPETGAYYPTLDVLAMGNAVLAMKDADVELVGAAFDVTTGLVRGMTSQASFSIQNAGSAASGTVTVDVYLSRNSNISSTGDIRVGTTTIDIPANSSASGTVEFTLPESNAAFWGFAEEYTLGMIIDGENAIGEIMEGNNLNQGQLIDKESVTIEKPPADLRGLSFELNTTSLFRGESLTANFRVENVGDGPSPPTEAAFYLTADSTVDPATDLLLGTTDVASLLAGQSTAVASISFTLPENSHAIWSAGTSFTVGMVLDATSVEAESDETNNLNRGLGLDLAAVQILPPPTRISGVVFEDEDNNGLRQVPFDGDVVFERAAGAVVDPRVTTTLTFTNLPAYRSSATLRVRALGDLNETAEFATIDIDDGLITTRVFDKEAIAGGDFVNADETIILTGAEWQAAMLDGELSVKVSFTNPSPFLVGSASWIRLTLSYDAESTDSYHSIASVENRTLVGRNSTVNLPATRPAIGDGVLTLVALGDVGSVNELAVVDLEGIVQFTMLDELAGAADMAESIESVAIPQATLNSLIADGNLQAVVAFSATVDNAFPGNFFQLRLDYPIESERGVAGVVVNLDINNDGTIDRRLVSQDDDPTTGLDETGRYDFIDVGVGEFGLALQVPQDWTQTLPGSTGYTVTLNEGEAKGGYEFGIFSSDVQPPQVAAVYVTSTAWSSAFVDTLGTNGIGQAVAVGDGPLPWSNVDRLMVQFSEAVFNVADATVELRNSDGVVATTVEYDPVHERAIIRLTEPLGFGKYRLAIADTLVDLAGNVLDGDQSGAGGGLFDFRFDVLPADGNRDGRVNGSDLATFSASFNRIAGGMSFDPFANWNGDERVNGADLAVFSANFNRSISSLSEPGGAFGGGGNRAGRGGGGWLNWRGVRAIRSRDLEGRDAFFSDLDDDEKQREVGVFE